MATAMSTAMSTGLQAQITSRASTASLDLHAILSSNVAESLLSTRLSFSSALASSQSIGDIPPFPTRPNPRIFLNDIGSSLQPTITHPPATPPRARDGSRSLLSSPMAPRLKMMLMEKLSVDSWVTSLGSSTDHPAGVQDPELDTGSDSSTCIVERDSTSPDPFQSTPRSPFNKPGCTVPTVSGLPTMESHPMALVKLSTSASTDSIRTLRPPLASSVHPAHHADRPSSLLLVPTIMVSNSTAALPVSLESSPSLHSNQEVPLAIRRGKNPPPALSLSQHGNLNNSYPDIPSAFMGTSPTSCSPTVLTFAAGEPSKFDMGLSAMCNSLKALVPPPPFTPTEAEHEPPSYPPPSLEPETRWGMVTSAHLPDMDDEEWAFVQELVVDWHASEGRVEISPSPSPPDEVADAATNAPGMGASISQPTAPTTTVPQREDDEANVDDVQGPLTESPPCIKQMRRKTVIIQAPDGGAILAVKTSVLSGGAADRNVDRLLDEFDEPVPFEIPSSTPLSASVPLVDDLFSTPPNSRPSSTASSATLPIRGILKEKKSVRFSAVPSLYEYGHAINDTTAVRPRTPFKHHSDSDVAALKRTPVSTTTRAPHRSSPLRETQTHSSDSSGSELEEDITALLAITNASATATVNVSAARPSTPMRVRVTPPTSFRTGARANSPNSSPSPMAKTTAKLPAVRALAHKSSPPRFSPLVGSGVGGAVVGAPALQSPYPAASSSPPKNQGTRTPLGSISTRQNTPFERKTSSARPSLTPVKQAQTQTQAEAEAQTPTPRPARKVAASFPTPTPNPASKGKAGGKDKDKDKENCCVLQTASAPNSPDQKRERVKGQDRRRRSAGVWSSGTQVKGSPKVALGLETPSACGGAPAGAGTAGSQKSSRMPVPLRHIFTKLRT